MRATIIAELATNHGGDVSLAKDMIRAAADAGADVVKTQAYQVQHLRPTDPQYAWFQQCELSDIAHETLMEIAARCGMQYLSTAFHVDDLHRLHRLGLTAVKIGSGEGRTALVTAAARIFETVYATLPWGVGTIEGAKHVIFFATVPLYPMPPECYARIKRHLGWSDHAIGIDVAKIAIAHGAQYLEKHFEIEGQGRNQPWNMRAAEVTELRRWAEVCDQANAGTKYEGRWSE